MPVLGCNDRVLHVPFDRFFLHAEDDFPFDSKHQIFTLIAPPSNQSLL